MSNYEGPTTTILPSPPYALPTPITFPFPLIREVHLCLSVSQFQQCPPPPPPPGYSPGISIFFLNKWANSPRWGHISCLNAPRWGRRKRANVPPPGSLPSNTSAVFLINQWIKCSTVQYFNATVRLQGQQYVLVDSDYIYFFIFVFNSLLEHS